MSILLAPEGEEPLNQGNWKKKSSGKVKSIVEAGEMIQQDPDRYLRIARECATGSIHNSVKYDKIL